MKKRINQSTFELTVHNGFLFDKTFHQNAEVAQGYQYIVKEFDFTDWVETGRWIKVQVAQVFNLDFQPDNTLSSIETLNRKYKFFKSEIIEVKL